MALPTPRAACALAFILALQLVPPPAAAAVELSWSDVLARLEAQPELAAAQAELAAAEGALRAIGLPNPELEGSAGRAEALAGDESADIWEWSASLPLRPWGPWRHERAAGRAERDAAGYEFALARREQERLLAARFWQVAHDQRQGVVLAEREAQLTRLVEIARLRAELGEARPTEPLRLEIELEQLAAAIRAAEAEALLNRQALGRRLDLDPPGDFSLVADWDSLPPLPASAGGPAPAHPLLAAETARAEGARASLAAARAERWPGLRVGAFQSRELDAESEGLSLAIELPLFDRRGGGVDRARAAAAAAGHRRTALARDYADALAAAQVRARLAQQQVESLRRGVLPRATQALAALEAEYRVGEAGLVELIDARRAHSDTETALLTAQLDYHLALADLKALAPGDDHD
jgi:cobalt-zinc-cadmium efflux system outer membrane protein